MFINWECTIQLYTYKSVELCTVDYCTSPAELGDYTPSLHTAAVVSEFRFVPVQTEIMEVSAGPDRQSRHTVQTDSPDRQSRQTVQTEIMEVSASPDRQSRQTVQTDSPVSASQDWDHGGQCQSWQSVQTDSPDRHSRQTVQTVPVQTDSPYSASPDWDHGGQNPKKPENYPFLHHHLRLHRGFYRTISHYLDTKGACLEGKEEGEHHNRENQNNRTFSHQYSFNLLGWYKLDRFGSRTFPMKLHHCTQGKILPLVIHQFTSLRLLSQFGGL